jgi:hypothetical protein
VLPITSSFVLNPFPGVLVPTPRLPVELSHVKFELVPKALVPFPNGIKPDVTLVKPVPPLATATVPVTFAALSVGTTSLTQAEEVLISKPLVVVLKITNPVAGLAIASRSVVVIRGGKNPWVVELTSSLAEAAGLLVPIPTCENAFKLHTLISKTSTDFNTLYFFILSDFIYL